MVDVVPLLRFLNKIDPPEADLNYSLFILYEVLPELIEDENLEIGIKKETRIWQQL